MLVQNTQRMKCSLHGTKLGLKRLSELFVLHSLMTRPATLFKASSPAYKKQWSGYETMSLRQRSLRKHQCCKSFTGSRGGSVATWRQPEAEWRQKRLVIISHSNYQGCFAFRSSWKNHHTVKYRIIIERWFIQYTAELNR